MREGIDRPSIWEGVHAQVLLGDEDFVGKLKDYVKGSEEIAEIPRTQRYLGRPILKTLFEGKRTKTKRDARIVEAVHRYGYRPKTGGRLLEPALRDGQPVGKPAVIQETRPDPYAYLR